MASQAVGTIGAVIMPHNLFLHSSLVLSRNVDRSNPKSIRTANKYNAIECSFSLLFSFFVNMAVVGTYAATFFNHECAVDENGPYALVDGTCQTIGLSQTQKALSGSLGASAKYVWAFGLLAAGQASTMTGTFAGQVVMEGFLNWKIAAWKRLAVTRSVALVPSMLVAIATSNHQSTSDNVDEWLNILQSVQLPFALLPLLYFTNSEAVMGKFKNPAWIQGLGYFLGGIVILTNFYLLVDFVLDPDSDTPNTIWFYILSAFFGLAYIAFLYAVTKDDLARIRDTIFNYGSEGENHFVPLVDEEEGAEEGVVVGSSKSIRSSSSQKDSRNSGVVV